MEWPERRGSDAKTANVNDRAGRDRSRVKTGSPRKRCFEMGKLAKSPLFWQSSGKKTCVCCKSRYKSRALLKIAPIYARSHKKVIFSKFLEKRGVFKMGRPRTSCIPVWHFTKVVVFSSPVKLNF